MKKQNRDIVYCSISDSLIAYSTFERKEIIVENILNNEIIYTKRLLDICYLKPVLNKGKLYFPNSDSELICLDIENDKVLWKLEIERRLTNIQFLNDSILLLNVKSEGFVAVNSANGKILYTIKYKYGEVCSSPDLSPYPIVYDTKSFYVSNWMCHTISAFRIIDGKEIWKKALKDGLAVSLVIDNLLFIGTNHAYEKGNIYILNKETGEVIYNAFSNFEERIVPLLNKRKIYYYTFDSKLNEFDIDTKKNKIIYEFNSQDDISGSKMYLLDDSIYFQDTNYILNRFDLTMYKKEIIGEYTEGMVSGVFKDKAGKVKFIY